MKDSIKTPHGNVTFPSKIQNRAVVANLWQNGDQCRVYFEIKFPGTSPVSCGFIDGRTGHKAIRSRPVSWGQRLEPEVIFEPNASVKKEETFNTGYGYFGTAKDAAKGFDGIE